MQRPDGPPHPPWSPERTREIARGRRDEPGPLLPILHDLLAEFGYVDPGAVPVVADVLRTGYRWNGRVLRAAMVAVRG